MSTPPEWMRTPDWNLAWKAWAAGVQADNPQTAWDHLLLSSPPGPMTRWIMRAADPDIGSSLKSLAAKSRVLALGNSHDQREHARMARRFLASQTGQDRVTHIVMEIDEVFQKRLDKFMSTGDRRLLDDIIYVETRGRSPEVIHEYESLLDDARKLGVKIVAGDPCTDHYSSSCIG